MKKAMLIIMDGWGIGDIYPGNSVMLAKTPNYKAMLERYPNSKLGASGLAVGLPEGQMGNSEVGHLNIGSGRIIYQDYTRITKSIVDRDFFDNEAFNQAIDHAIKNGTKLHLMGLYSDGGVHSHNSHLFALLELCKKRNFDRVYVHAFTDGRDVAPQISNVQIIDLLDKFKELGIGRLATISGRYYAMDRDKRWERTKLAYDAMVYSQGKIFEDPVKAIEASYTAGVNDEFIEPIIIADKKEELITVDKGDSIIFFNFRPDRARQLSHAFTDQEFDGFERKEDLSDLFYVTFTEYDKTLENVHIAYKQQSHTDTLGQVISEKGLKQIRIAETEKYGHVTFFFNGGVEKPNEGEDRLLVPSPKVATYDLKPEMSAEEVRERALEVIESEKYDLIILNFANSDMVGHTGVISASVKAVETVDACTGALVKAAREKGYSVLVTADHGNSEKMIDTETGKPFTAHTTNPVPFILISDRNVMVRDGILADIAPTILELMEIEKPAAMTGKSLIMEG